MASNVKRIHRLLTLVHVAGSLGLSVKSSFFLGRPLVSRQLDDVVMTDPAADDRLFRRSMTMRKQKASDRRTRRRQRGIELEEERGVQIVTVTESPMKTAGPWRGKTLQPDIATSVASVSGGRGRSRKRSTLYNSLSSYYNHYLRLLTLEYQVEEDEVIGRIKASAEDPSTLEQSGFALFDLYPTRRGNLFSDEVYRLSKAHDAAFVFGRPSDYDSVSTDIEEKGGYLPSNHKFTRNDVIMITLQPNGSGGFLNPLSMPTDEHAVSVEARVLNTGPTYVDIAIPSGKFDMAFGPAPNDRFQQGDKSIRLRADRFLSKIPFQRMVQALTQITSIPSRPTRSLAPASIVEEDASRQRFDAIVMDEVIREAILSTHAHSDHPLGDSELSNMQELTDKLSKPPMRDSQKLAFKAVGFIDLHPAIFPRFNAPQRVAIEAALSRRMTLIQGPPGTGKTTVAAAIAYGFAMQCRAISPYTKVLACAFSNVGADNLAEAMLRVGLKVARIGKASAVTEQLWNITLDAAIDRDPNAANALTQAARATAQLAKLNKSTKSGLNERVLREQATAAVQESIRICNIAATKELRAADVIISTSSGAADPRLMTACGIVTKDTDDAAQGSSSAPKASGGCQSPRELAPDGLPPISLPFVLVDEACQSVEPATLIPIVFSNSCRSLVLLGDPCQLPPTVRSSQAASLSISLMERLSTLLPKPALSSQVGDANSGATYVDSLAMKQSVSLLRSREVQYTDRSYRKRFAGSLLLSVQYRMHPSISAFPSAVFYDGLLSTPHAMTSLRVFPSALEASMPCNGPPQGIRVMDVGGRCNERRGNPAQTSAFENQTSYWNEAEAVRVVSLLNDIIRSDQVQSVGIISPYSSQVSLIKTMVAADQKLLQLISKLKRPLSIEVNSVDGYQGRERDVIIVSTVRSNRQGRIGFLEDWRRMNVAMTRAKCGLFVVGDLATLAEGDTYWAAFVQYANRIGVVINTK